MKKYISVYGTVCFIVTIDMIVKHCEINYVNRYTLFYINFTLILLILNMDEASREKKKKKEEKNTNILDEIVLARAVP